MGTKLWILNGSFTVLGVILFHLSLSRLLHHQYVLQHYSIWSDDPKRFVPTIVPLVVGLLLFISGLFGFVHQVRSKISNK